nr:hypothetical protein [Tanacetum cinerariifolium]
MDKCNNEARIHVSCINDLPQPIFKMYTTYNDRLLTCFDAIESVLERSKLSCGKDTRKPYHGIGVVKDKGVVTSWML